MIEVALHREIKKVVLTRGESMKERSLLRALAAGLLATFALSTPSRANFLVEVSSTLSISDTSITDSISSVTLTYSNSEFSGPLDTMTNLSFTGSAVTLGPPVALVTPGLSSDASAGTFTLTFAPSVFTIGGGISFDTITTTDDVNQLGVDIKFLSYKIVTATVTDQVNIDSPRFTVIPEPSSISLIGIGLSGISGFCLLFKRPRPA
jgi:hypothetical protein